MALGVLGVLATIAQMTFLSRVVDQAFLRGSGLRDLGWLLALLLAAVVVRAVLLWGREVVAARGAGRAKSKLREEMFAHLLRLGPVYSARESTGELATTSTEGVERLEPYLARYLPQVYLSALAPLLIGVYVLALDPVSGTVLLATGPAIPVLMVLIGRRAEEHSRRQWEALSRMGSYFLEALRALPTLKAFGRSDAAHAEVGRTSEEFRRRTMRVLRYAFISGLALEFVATVSIALVAVLLAMRLLFGDLPFQTAFLVLLLAPEFYGPLRELGVQRHAGMEGKAAADRIVEILHTPAPAATSSATSGSARAAPPLPRTVEISLRGLGYSYPGSERPALRGVDLTLPASGTTALVGPSGSGKSTLAALLLRFAEPTQGGILAGGLPIADLPVEAWRERVSLVPQRPHLFHGSVADNLRLARPQARLAELRHAASLAGADEFIERLPGGYDTRLGERGARLSAGEAQRVAIARAFLKDAPLLVMDEPASSLDPESEYLLEAAVGRLARDRTTLVVAHRLNTARAADHIAVLDGGRVVETGAHGTLISGGGAYARLVGAHGG